MEVSYESLRGEFHFANAYALQLYEKERIARLAIPFSEIWHRCNDQEWADILEFVQTHLPELKKPNSRKPYFRTQTLPFLLWYLGCIAFGVTAFWAAGRIETAWATIAALVVWEAGVVWICVLMVRLGLLSVELRGHVWIRICFGLFAFCAAFGVVLLAIMLRAGISGDLR